MVKATIPDPLSKNIKERHVSIFSVGGKNVVWPPYLFVKEGETVVFHAVNTPVTILLPKPAMLLDKEKKEDKRIETLTEQGVLFQIPEGKLKRFTARNRKLDKKFKKWLKDKKLAREYPIRGAYAYSVFCDKMGDFAEGNSSPVMIFEPPEPPPPRPQ